LRSRCGRQVADALCSEPSAWARRRAGLGKPKTYDATADRRILALLERPPPRPPTLFGLYLNPPEHAVVLAVDEKPAIQALERAQGYLKLPNGRALTGFAHAYKRHGTTTLFAALEVATGQSKAKHRKRRPRLEFLDFMNWIVADYPNQENPRRARQSFDLQAHARSLAGPAQERVAPLHADPRQLAQPGRDLFSILARSTLQSASFTSVRQLRQAIDAFIAAYNPTALPFQWHKAKLHPKGLAERIADL
jgi:hypothetical protein